MKCLAFDAATEARTVARHDSDRPSDDAEIFEVAARSHGPRLVPDARHLLAEAGWHWHDVDILAFGRGPGAFTGLRIAAGLVQGLASGLDRPVVGVETPRVIAARCLTAAPQATVAQVVQDARLGEIYTARYQRDATHLVRGSEQVMLTTPGALSLASRETGCAGGNGWSIVAESQPEANLPAMMAQWPHALDLAHLAVCDLTAEPSAACLPRDALPLYVRDQVASGSRQSC